MKNVFLNVRTAKAQAEGCAKVSRMAKILTTLTLLLTLAVGQMWAAYYVPGTLTAWSLTSSEQMTQVGSTNTYYKVVSSKAKGDYQFRVTAGSWDKDHGWSQAIAGSSDFTLTSAGSDNNINIKLTATSTLTVWFDSDDDKIWVTSGDYATQTVYVIGSNSWTDSNVKAHAFTGAAAYYAWASDQTMTKTSTISRAGITYKVYSYTFPKGYKGIIFRYGSSQTDDLTWNASTTYYSVETSGWYATTADALAKYLVGQNWTDASWDHTAAANKMTDNGDGSYSKNISISDATKEIALKISAKGTWTPSWDKDDKGTGYNLSQALGGSDNLTFKVSHAGTTKVTLTSDGKINVYGPYQVSYAAGTGATGTVSASAVTTYGSTCTLSSSTYSKTGYTQDGWATSNGGGKSYNLGGTYTGGYVDVTLYPHWTANTYTVEYNANDDQYPGTASGSTTSSSHTYGTAKNLTSNGFSRTGYIFAGWATSPTGDVAYTNGQSVTNLSSTQGATVTLYAKWTAITLSATISPSTIDANTATSIRFTITTNAPLSSGYYFEITNWGGKNSGTAGGYNIDGDHQITSASPFTYDLAAAKTNLDAGTYKIKLKITKDAVTQVESDLLTLTVSSSTYTVTVGVSPAGYGTVSPTSISASPDSWSGDITATPNAGYRFVNWTSSGGGITINNNTSATTQVKATSTGGTLTANFAAATYRVTLDNQSATTAGTPYVDATYNTTTFTTITKPTKTNYTFGGYYTEVSGGGTQIIDANGNWLASKSGFTDGSKKSIITEDKTLYAKWTETTYAVTVAVDDASHASGNIDCSAAGWEAGKSGTAQIGNLTNVTITVGAAAAGYKFDGGYWTLTGGVTLIDGSLTSPSIIVKATATGSATYTYAEDLTSTYYVEGDASGPFTYGWNANANTMMMKRTGYSTSSDVYWELEVPASKTSPSNNQWEFKIYNDASTTGEKWYGWGNGSDHYWLTKDNNNLTLSTTGSNTIYLKCYVEGTYTFHVNYSTPASPTLEVSWPVVNQLRISSASPADAGNTGNYDLVEGSDNDWSVSRNLNAGTTYTFKMVYEGDWYGKNSTNLTRASNSASALSTDGADMTIETDVAGSYTFTFNSSSKNLSVTYPAAYKLTYSIGDVAGTEGSISSSPSTSSGSYVPSGNTVTLTGPAPAAGYNWKGWYTNAAGTEGKIDDTNRAITVTMNADKTLYACYTEKNYTVTVTSGEGGYVASGSVTGHVSTKVTLPTATAYPGYRFVNWTTTTGSVTYTDQTSANTAQVNGLTAPATVRANFERTYAYIEGRFHVTNANRDGNWTNTFSAGDWDENSTSIPFAYDGSAHEFYLRTFATPKELSDQISSNNPYFYIKISRTDGSLTNTSSYRPYTSGAAYQQLTAAGEGNKKQIITPGNTSHSYWFNSTDESGYVKLYFNQSYIWYWLEQTLEYNANGGTGDAPTAKTYYDKGTNATAGTNTFTRTGYHFNGWKTGPSSGTSYAEGASVTMNSNITLYAQWEAETYDISLDQQESAAGWSASGTAAVPTVTYNAVLPAITGTMPTTTGSYGFMGFYTEPLGAGLRLTDGTGAWIADVDGYTDEDKKWIHAGDVTLYAYYRTAQITGITFSTGYVIAPSTSTTVTANIEPTPAVTTSLCWTVLHSNDNPLETQPTFTPASGSSVTFTTPETSTSYKIVATLRTGSVCGSGDIIDQDTVNFQVAGNHSVTVQYKCGSATIKASSTVTGRPLAWSSAINPPEIFGYTFSSWTAGDGVTISTDGENPIEGSTTTTARIYIKAIYDGSLTANYTQKNYIYFKNTLNWSSVYINFYPENYWGYGDKVNAGSGNSGITNRNLAMTQIDDTDVWYYDYGGASIVPTNYVSFTEDIQEDTSTEPSTGYQFFWKANPGENVVYPARHMDSHGTDRASELGFYSKTPMFVPIPESDVKLNVSGTGWANYFSGYWTKYTPGTGYTLQVYTEVNSVNVLVREVEFTSPDDLMPMKATLNLEASHTYKFQLKRDGDVYYGNESTMTYKDHGQNTAWEMHNEMDPFKLAQITTNAAGDYTFHLSYSPNSSDAYRLRMEVDYPIASGDYRVIYTDNTRTGWKESAIVTQAHDAKDTVSFFIRPGSSPAMKIQQATVNGETGAISWSAGTDISSSLSGLTKDSVYNICLKMDGEGAISVENVEVYTGNFYIRTDAANSKWDNYRSDPDHLMTYSEYSITHGGYSHYYCHWVTIEDAKRKNVKFTIANDYSPCISDTLTRETASGEWANIERFIDEHGNLLRSANVRFMWDQHTNTIRRAYLDPAKGDDNFLVLASADSKIANASEVVQTAVVFSDNENWIYEANVKAKANAQIKLVATWGDAPTTIVQYFKGSADETETLITGDNEDTNWYDIRLIYDYKTNRLIAALLPSGNIDDPKPINADVMFIREHQGDISQVTFTDDGALTDIKIAYGVLRFNKWTLNNKEKTGSHSPLAEPKSIYERAMYFISFPFEVNLSEVFGFGTYGQDWIVEYYDGAERARTGWWEGKPGFWRYVWDRKNFVLEPNVGYLLELELGNFKDGSGFWNNDNERLELFFPSSGNLGSITNTTVNCSIPEHACTINRAETEGLPDTGDPRTSYNRTIFDSHWNVMPVPTYVNATPNAWNNTTWTAKIGPKFLYTWNMDDNTLTATSGAGYRYHAMHAYMVQYGGNVQWETSASPAAIVARNTYAEEPKEVEFRLEIQQNEKMIDQTFIALSNDETVSADFQFGEDMSKDFNARNANIFTKIGNTFAAGNTMPMTDQKTIVPVGVVVKKTGDYTFSIPEGTNGIGITLIDEETGIRTSLSALDYTVELAAGDYTERFWLEISPVKGAETGIDPGVDARENSIRKVMIDGLLYIIRDGKMYDATGKRVE